MKLHQNDITILQFISMILIGLPIFRPMGEMISLFLNIIGITLLFITIGYQHRHHSLKENILGSIVPCMSVFVCSFLLNHVPDINPATVSFLNSTLTITLAISVFSCLSFIFEKYLSKIQLPLSLVISIVSFGLYFIVNPYYLFLSLTGFIFYQIGRLYIQESEQSFVPFQLHIHPAWFIAWAIFLTTYNWWFFLDFGELFLYRFVIVWILSDSTAYACSTLFPQLFTPYVSTIKDIITNKLPKLWNIGFYILLFIVYNYAFYTTTTFTSLTIIPSAWTTLYRLAFVAIMLYGIATILQMESKNRILFSIALLVYANIHMQVIGTEEVFIMCAVIVSAHNKSAKAILSIAFYCGLAWCIGALIASYKGVIPMLTYSNYDGSKIKYALGIMYSTDAMAHYMFLYFISQVLYPRKMNIIRFICYSVLLYTLFYFTGGRTGFICAMGYTVIKFMIDQFNLLNITPEKMKIVFKKVLPYTFVCMTIFSIALVFVLHNETDYSQSMGSFYARMQLGYRALTEYPIQLFGYQIPEIGNGGINEWQPGYFFIDCFYIRMLMKHGIVLFGLWLIASIKLIKKAIYNNNIAFVLVLVFVAIDGLMEHHLADISYNIFFCFILINVYKQYQNINIKS